VLTVMKGIGWLSSNSQSRKYLVVVGLVVAKEVVDRRSSRVLDCSNIDSSGRFVGKDFGCVPG
jgi:hypothetical protein